MAIRDKDERQGRDERWPAAAESSAGVSGALTLASTEASIAVTPDDLDADPFLLNCRNGTLDLRTGELRAHDPADLLTKIDRRRPTTRTPPAPSSPSSWRRSSPSRPCAPTWPGCSATPWRAGSPSTSCRSSTATARNGKGTLIDAVLSALGDYADAADPELLTARTFDAHPTGTADLFGLRLAILHESDAGPPAGRGHRQAADRRRPDQGPADARGLLALRPVATRS